MKKFLGTMTAFAVALSASAALAGTYVAGPLGSEFGANPGSIPPDPSAYKAQAKLAKEESKLTAGLAKCYSKGAKNVSKGKPSGVNTCINNSKKGVFTKYLASTDKIASKSLLPPCNDPAVDGQSIAGLVKLFNPTIYCQSPSGAFIDQAHF